MPKLTDETIRSAAGKLRKANSDLKNQIADYAAKLGRINRFLSTLKVCNQAVLHATQELLKAIRLVTEPDGAAVKSSCCRVAVSTGDRPEWLG